MKKTELVFNLISIPVDAMALLLAGIISFYLRQEPNVISKPIVYQLNLSGFLHVAYKMDIVLILIFALLGLYNLRGTRKFSEEFLKIIMGTSLGLLLIILMFFFNQTIFPSRFIILAAWGLGIFFIVLGRLILNVIQKTLFRHGIGLHKLVLINGFSGNSGIIEDVYKNKNYGYEITGEVSYSEGIFENLEQLHSQKRMDEILQANPNLSEEANLRLVQFARNKGISYSFVPNLFEVQRNSIEISSLKGVPIISLKNTPLDGWGNVVKRIFDIVVSLICIITTLPVFLIIIIAIKLDSKGKVIYIAQRGGKGRDFDFYKFRSMYNHLSVGQEYGGQQAEIIRMQLWEKNERGGSEGPFLKIKDDPRVTKVGRILRRTKLDEIPQFYNVLKGDMSMVGPRAHVIDEVAKYRNRYLRMFSIKPGIFGLSQISQVSTPNLPFEDEIKLNTYYIENWSLWLDIKILARSFFILMFGSKTGENY